MTSRLELERHEIEELLDSWPFRCFSHEVSPHFLSAPLAQTDLAFLHAVLDPKEGCVNVLDPPKTTTTTYGNAAGSIHVDHERAADAPVLQHGLFS